MSEILIKSTNYSKQFYTTTFEDLKRYSLQRQQLFALVLDLKPAVAYLQHKIKHFFSKTYFNLQRISGRPMNILILR